MRKPSDISFQRSLAPAVWAVLVLATGAAPARAADGPAAFAVPKEVLAVFAAHCADRHGDRGKLNVDVTAFDKLKPGDRLETHNKTQDQLFSKMMPPSAGQPADLRGARARRVPAGGPRPGPVAALRPPRRDHRLTLSPPSAFVKST